MAKFDLAMLDAKEIREVKTLRGSLTPLLKQLGVVREKAAALAPKVKRLFKQLDAKHDCGFVGFCRLFDAAIPEKPEEYRKHRTYMAMDYIRRVWMQQDRPAGAGRGKKDVATDPLARMLATLFQFISTPGPVYAAVQREFNLGDRGLKQLQTRVESAKPIINLSGIIGKPVAVDEKRIVHMEPTPKVTAPSSSTEGDIAGAQAALAGIVRRRPGRPAKNAVAA